MNNFKKYCIKLEQTLGLHITSTTYRDFDNNSLNAAKK
jgi:hypothetical protein